MVFLLSRCVRKVLSSFLLLSLFSLLWLTLPVAADGGAPQLAYVAGTTAGLGVITIAQQRVTGSIALPGSASMVLLSPNGYALYVAQPALGRVSVLNARTGKLLCADAIPGQPTRLALSLDASILYVGGPGDTRVRAIDPATCAIKRTFETHQPVYGLAVAASTALNATPFTPNQIWVSGTNALTIFDAQGAFVHTISVVAGPQYISIPAGFTAYVTTRQGTVLAVDLPTMRVFQTLLSGGQFAPLDYDAATGEVYVPDKQHNQVDVLIPSTIDTSALPQEPVRVLHFTTSPQSIAITSDGQLGFVALASGQVAMLDIPGHSTITTLTVGGVPDFIITGLYPPAPGPATVPPSMPAASSSSLLVPILSALLVGLLLSAGLWFFWRRSLLARSTKQTHDKA